MFEIERADVRWFIDDALDKITAIVAELGDELANRAPHLPGANTPFAILTHCLGVMEFWGGQLGSGRVVVRDRAGEFVASGPVAPLLERIDAAQARFAEDLEVIRPRATPTPGRAPSADPYDNNQASVVLHILEELYQHLGQLEITRDLLVAKTSQAQ